MKFRPLLSATIKPDNRDQLRYPLIASPKLDGIRCLIHPDAGPVSRNFKPIPNEFVRRMLNSPELHGYDGELVLSKDPKDFTFNDVQSAVMSRTGQPEFIFVTFDHFLSSDDTWISRYAGRRLVETAFVWPLPHLTVHNWEGVELTEQEVVDRGFEGLMLRNPHGPYKFGRSTMREQYLMKLKRYQDSEGEIIGFIEQLHNENPLEQDAYGLAKRSSHKENLTGANTLGKLVLKTEKWGEVHVGTGFTDALRAQIWNNRSRYLGLQITFKHEPVLKDKPRFPVFLRFRQEE